MNATSRTKGAVRAYPRRGLGALLAVALFAVGLFSFAHTPPAHAAAGVSPAKQQLLSGTALRGAGTSEKALRAAARRATKDGRSTARAAANSPVSIGFEWWGARIILDRSVGCWAAKGLPQFEQQVKNNISSSGWALVAISAIQLYKYVIGAQMGSQGVELHLNWFGIVHWIAPNGPYQPC